MQLLVRLIRSSPWLNIFKHVRVSIKFFTVMFNFIFTKNKYRRYQLKENSKSIMELITIHESKTISKKSLSLLFSKEEKNI